MQMVFDKFDLKRCDLDLNIHPVSSENTLSLTLCVYVCVRVCVCSGVTAHRNPINLFRPPLLKYSLTDCTFLKFAFNY